LRAQARAESTAHERRHDAHIVGLHVEHAAKIALHVLHALGLVVDRELAAAIPPHRRGIRLHRVVVLDPDVILALMAYLRRSQCPFGRAAPLWRGEHVLAWPRDRNGLAALAMEVSGMCFFVVVHADQRRRETRNLPFLGDDQRDWLSTEPNRAVVKRPERRTF